MSLIMNFPGYIFTILVGHKVVDSITYYVVYLC